MTPLEQLKDRARQGDAEALRELRDRGFFAKQAGAASYPASDAQRRLWVLDQMAPASASYNIPGALRLTGVLDEDAFERAVQALVVRHEALRTRFAMTDGDLRQVVEPSATLTVRRIDLSHEPDPSAAARQAIALAAATAFRLDAAPLVSAALYRLAADDRVFAFTIHHIVADGWSLGVLFRELLTIYEAFARGAANPLPPLRLQYKDVTAWQRQRLDRGELEAARRYWLERLADPPAPAELPRDFQRPAVQRFDGGHVVRELPRATVAALDRLGASSGATMFMTLMTAARILLLRYTGQPDIVIGTPVSGRSHPDLEGQVGFYVNLLPLRTAIEPEATVAATLSRVRGDAAAAYGHDYPFDRLVDELDLARDLSRSPLFDVLLSLEEEPMAADVLPGLQIEPFAFPVSTAKYDLTFFFTRSRGAMSLSVNYSRALFRHERIEVLADHLMCLLENMAVRPDARVAEIAIAPAAEMGRVREAFALGPAPYPRDASIAELFEAQAAATPDAEAVVSDDGTRVVRLTYQELNARAERVAQALRARGVTLETPVGVRLERSERIAVALLGILKAGGCYVPIEAAAPPARQAFVIADAGCRLVIDEAELAVLVAEGETSHPRTPHSRTHLAPSHGRTLVYVMYTSGSTGEPKGALIEQRSVVRLVRGNRFLQLGPGDRVLQTGALAFDASTLEIWGPLLNGGCVCFAAGEELVVASRVRALIARHRITVMWVTASLLNQWVDTAEDLFGTLRCLLTGGEKLSPPHIARLRSRYPALALVNGYGPTENTTFTACHAIEQVDEGDIPIGRPISNTSVLILDERGECCPVGVPGEICAAGDGMARGYLNRPDLTAERFVPHPFENGGRLYRTGDLGRWRRDGTIEFAGRRDTQVKVRGYRIEIGEIESRLRQHPQIADACVIARAQEESGPLELAAYYVAGPAGAPGAIAIREYLAEALPAYMVPARVVRLGAMPLTRNGKVDRAALPAPGEEIDRRAPFEEPRTPVERALCAIWSDVLQAGEVGIRDNFFELGGHSLKATRALSRIHREVSDRVTLRDIFACPDVASLAERITPGPATRRAAIPRAAHDGLAPASHAQRRLWLLQQLSGDTGAYNVPGAVLLEGALDAAALAAALTRLVERHESLRTGFVEIGGRLCQRVADPFTVAIPAQDVASLDEARRLVAADAATPFALDSRSLFRAALFRLTPARHLLSFNLHHIVTDGWSMRVLLGEWLELYRTIRAGEPDQLPALRVQYRDYAVWQHAVLAGEEGQRQREYWLGLFKEEPPALDLPVDRPRPAVQTFRGDVVRTHLDAATVAALRRLARRHGATLYTTLMAVVRVLLFRQSGQDDFVIGTGVSGRDHADLDQQIGFYVNMLPLRQRVAAGDSFDDTLRRTRDVVSDALEHQGYPFDQLVGDLDLRREAGRQPLFDVVVTLDEEERAPGAAPLPDGLRALPFELSSSFSKFDLMFAFTAQADQSCAVVMEYATDLFDRDRIERMRGQFARLVESVLADASVSIARMELLPDEERRQLARFAGTRTPYPAKQTVASVFEQQAAATPAAIAIAAGARELTYQELDARAGRVARALLARGVALEDRIGVRLDRSERIVIALLGILKAGACYVPLEPGAPESRIAFMVEDAGCRLVIDEAELAALEAEGPPTHLRAAHVRTHLAPAHGRTLAYVMYTSGSTGQPKGTLIEHRSILRLVRGADYLQLGPDDRLLQTGSIAFDASTLEIWGPLLNGGRVCFAPSDVLLDAGRMRAAIAGHGITAMFVTTSLFNQLVDGDHDVFAGLRCLMTGGEKVSAAHINAVKRRHPSLALLHVYGPTENTTFTTWFPVEREHALDVPIGRPLANTTVYVLDAHGGLAPIGVPGEICTGGDGLARGYLNRPELTAERFVPRANDPDDRVYRTGDVGRWNADGDIEFIGRRDNQVKVHGYRVEPGEIEARLLQHPAVAQAAVLARATTAGTQELVAYYAGGADAGSARAFLAASLPPYMVPSEFIPLPALPLNQNGKIDRRALAGMRPAPANLADEASAQPETLEEQALAAVWCAVLDRPRVGRDEHYFDAGGDSIRAIQIVNRLRKDGWSVDVRDVFQYPVLRDAALKLTRANLAPAVAVDAGEVPLTPIQRWFFTRAGDLHHFNHALLLRCAGGIGEDHLRAAVAAVLAHHLALRLTLRMDAAGRPSAMADAGIDAWHGTACEVRDLRHASYGAWQADMQAVQAGFTLAGGPLFKAVLYRRPDGDRLLLVAHHLIIDGVSWRIVLEDLEQAYAAAVAGTTPALTPQRDSYVAWARAIAPSDDAVVTAPHRRAGESPHTYGDSAYVEATLDEQVTGALLREVHAAFHTTIDDLLLTALARTLGSRADGEALWVAMEGHGRDAVQGIDVGAAVGWFTRIHGVPLPAPEGDEGAQLRRVKEALRTARREGIEAPPACRVSVNYMGQIDERVAPGGRFALADEPCGNPIGASVERSHELDVGGVVRHGRLTLSLTYGRRSMTEREAAQLVDTLANELRALVAFCRHAAPQRTPSDFTGCPLSLPAYDALLAAHGWDARSVEDVYPLTPLQEGLLFQSLLDAGSRAYFLQLNYRMAGPLDVDRFIAAWQEVARRHPALRSAIVHDEVDRPLQVVLGDRRLEARVEDLTALGPAAQDARIAELRQQDMARGVDLQRDPLMRMTVLRQGADRHHVIWSYHHVLLDGWSLGVLYREFLEIYRAGDTRAPRLPSPRPFAEYMRWLLRQDGAASRRYWLEYLADYTPAALVDQLAGRADLGRADPVRSAGAGEPAVAGEQTLRLDPDLTRALARTATAAGVTLNTVIQALWSIVLARYTGATDVGFGAVVSGRPAALGGVEEMVGLFINTVPVRVRVDEAEPFAALLRRLQHEAVAAEPHHAFPLAELQASQPGGWLFDHLLVFENYPLGSGGDGADSATVRVEAFEAHDRTHYDLDLTIVPGESLEVRFSYRADRLASRAVAALSTHLGSIAAAAAETPDAPVSRLPMLAPDEETALLDIGRGPRVEYPIDQPLHVLFEARAAATPDAVAARHNGRGLRYAQLNARANQVAHWLREIGVGRGDFVGLQLRRGLDLLAAMLGVLKAGAAFVPMDPDYPDDRIRYMREDSGARTVVTALPDDLARRPAGNVESVSGPRDIAYLLYTSGSTGRPKGAQVRHDGAVNHIFAEADLLRLHAGTAFLQSAPSSSDISVWQFLAPGLVGGRTVIADYDDVADAERLCELMRREGVTLCELVPAVMQAWLDHVAALEPAARRRPALECAMVTGETVPVPLVNRWVATYPEVPLVNAYGPTEAADDICQSVITAPLPADAASVSIGRPIANLRLYVLDGSQRLVPFGAAGEICVSGIGVGAGYWRNPSRTAEAFVTNPYAEHEHDTVLYRTGDRGRWRPDGELECLGRLDQQVKVRGHRVELEEVEHRLLEHPDVQQVIAGIREVAGDPALVAWIVGDVTPAALREHLRARVPAHMIPSRFVALDELPRTPSGKIDRRALALRSLGEGGLIGDDAAPTSEDPLTPVEEQLAAIWRDVLQVAHVGRHDSFFELGGHSLKAMQAVSRVHRDLGTRLSLQDFFAAPTVASLAPRIEGRTATSLQPIARAPAAVDYELSHAQKRLWLLHHLDGQVAYNMPEAIVLDEPVDRQALRRAFTSLVERHEALRTAFVLVDGQPRQRILDARPFEIREEDLTAFGDRAEAEAASRAAAEAAVPFDLAQPPLLRAVLYRLSPAREIFLMVIHHIIGDGWSMNVLYREVLALYEAHRRGRPDPLAPLGIQYKDFALWQNAQDLSRHERYWLDALAGAPDRLALPYDLAPSGDRDFSGGMEEGRIDAATVTRLKTLAAARGTTVSNVVLALFQLFLYQWTRQPDLCVGLAIANRNRTEIENLIGFFVNILPIRVQASSEMEFTDLLAAVHHRTTEAFEHQDYPFDLLVERLNPGRAGNRQPILNVIYAFQNFEDVAIDIGASDVRGVRLQPDQDTPARGAVVRPFKVPFETSKFDLTLFVTDMEGDLALSLEYDSRLFRRETIHRAVATIARFAGMVGA